MILLMVERHLIVDNLKFSYEGLFNASEFCNLISSFFYDKGWDWYEKMNDEQITNSGKQVRIILEPWKSSSDYYKLSVKIKIHMTDLKEVEVEQDGKKLRLNHGVIHMVFDGFVTSDRNNKWTHTPFYWFLSIIFEKYFFRSHFEKMQTWIESDVEDLYNKIKTYLNVFKYSYKM